jgi:hypothetical protein
MKNKFNVPYKSSDLTSVLVEHFDKSLNLARIKFIILFIFILSRFKWFVLKSSPGAFKTVARVTLHCDEYSFMANCKFDKGLIAQLIFTLLLHDPPYPIAST